MLQIGVFTSDSTAQKQGDTTEILYTFFKWNSNREKKKKEDGGEERTQNIKKKIVTIADILQRSFISNGMDKKALLK